MPLIKSPSKKAFKKNVETEMKANPNKRAQNLAIAYSTQRQAKGRKRMESGGPVTSPTPRPKDQDNVSQGLASIRKAFKSKGGEMYADGGEVKAASFRPDADEMEPRGLDMRKKARGEDIHSPEINFHDEHMSGIDDAMDAREMDMTEAHSEYHDPRKKLAFGGELSFNDEEHYTIDDYDDERSHNMLDAKPTRHAPEKRAATKMVDEDDSDNMEMGMLHTENQPDEYSKEGLINYAKGGSVADKIRRKRMMAEGGDVDLQDNNGDEHLNEEDQLSFEAPRKKTYYDDSQISSQPEDSNEHDSYRSTDSSSDIDDIEKDKYDMIGAIRTKMKLRRGRF